MHPDAAAGQPSRRIRGDHPVHQHKAQQCRLVINQAAPLTCSEWRTHYYLLPDYSAASERMSIRQPVRRAASRAFCPSRPMARLSW